MGGPPITQSHELVIIDGLFTLLDFLSSSFFLYLGPSGIRDLSKEQGGEGRGG
jgi:hypothetical protein